MLPIELIDLCITFFFDNLYPTQPIIERVRVGQAVALMYDDTEAYVFVVSLCAYVGSHYARRDPQCTNKTITGICAFSPT